MIGEGRESGSEWVRRVDGRVGKGMGARDGRGDLRFGCQCIREALRLAVFSTHTITQL